MAPRGPTAERVNVLGLGVNPLTMPRTCETIEGWVAAQDRRYVCLAAVHSVMAARRDPALRRAFNGSGLTTPDGMALVWLCRAAGYRHVDRVYGPDLMLAVSQRSVESGWRHFYFGGGERVAADLAARLQLRFPGLKIAGTLTPPFGVVSPEEKQQFVRTINESRADIVWVGLGTGRQEKWIMEHRSKLEAPVLISVGAAFDFLSGRKPQAPRWMQRGGLEWLFRLASEPTRLWPRYREYPLFLILLAAQLAGVRTYPMDLD